MAHIPHVFLPGPWRDDVVDLQPETVHHLSTVLRRGFDEVIHYTDGRGLVGEGRLGDRVVLRGTEHSVPLMDSPVIAVAPPAARDRTRFLVEKLAEIGVPELIWLRTRYGEGRPPPEAKTAAWCRAALEQSRGAWLMKVSGPVGLDELPAGTVFADVDGPDDALRTPVCIAIGPEGGWAPGEIAVDAPRLSLGRTVLRVETAAIVAAARAGEL